MLVLWAHELNLSRSLVLLLLLKDLVEYFILARRKDLVIIVGRTIHLISVIEPQEIVLSAENLVISRDIVLIDEMDQCLVMVIMI